MITHVKEFFLYLIFKNLSREKTVSLNTGAFTRAKHKLNEFLLRKIAFQVNRPNTTFLWKKRDVKIIDGTTIIMEDTKENQKEYPQNPCQKPGLGQPIMRCLGVFSYATGALIDIETSSYLGKGTAEPSLLRRMLNRFCKKDILLMDRFFTSFFLHCELGKRKIDFVVRS